MIVNGFRSKAAALRHLRSKGFKVSGLLAAPLSNPKVAKNGKVMGVLTAPLHLAPADLSGFNVCPMASAGCRAACLHTAGNPAYMAGKDTSRKAKTRAYMTERAAFMAVLTFEIAAHVRRAEREGMAPAVRLNATSDLPWERVRVTVDGTEHASIMDAFPGVSFYDYTKVTKRAVAWAEGRMPANYHLTFSRAEDNDAAVRAVLAAGGNVSMVVAVEPGQRTIFDMSHTIHHAGFDAPVTDGDLHDYRPADPKGCIVALRAKGDARQDRSGFVLR